jgi:hypothetical protein
MRYATTADHPAIMSAALRMLARSPAPQMKLADESAADSHFHMQILRRRIAIVGDFAIMFDVDIPWYSDQRVLIEDLILRISNEHNNPVETAIAALDDIAAEFGCTAIAVGDTQIGYMRPKYEAHGYVPMGTQLLKG